MNILVTGGAGFIGSTIADAYIGLGHNVIIIDNLSTGSLDNVPKGSSFYQMDIRDDDVFDIIRQHDIEIVNHHAAQIDVRRSVLDPKYDLSVNVLGSINLIEAGIRHGVARLIFASTGGAIYGEQDYFPADEAHPTNPCSPYGITKLTVEKYLNYYRIEKGLVYTVLRYTNVYGPRQNPHGEAGVVAIFCEKMLTGGESVINGDGMQTRDYVYVNDVVAANVRALSMEGTDTFNVCTGIESTVVDIFRILNGTLKEPVAEIHGPAKPGEQRRSVCSYEKVQAALDWSPATLLSDGLVRTMEFFRQRSLR